MDNSFLFYFKVAVLGIIPIILLIKEKGLKIYNPALLLSFIYFLEYGIPVLIIMYDPAYVREQLYYFTFESMDKGLTFCVWAFLLFLLGYYLPVYSKPFGRIIVFILSKTPNVNNFAFNIKYMPKVLITILILGWISRFVVIRMGLYYHATVENVPLVDLSGYKLIAQYISIGFMMPVAALMLSFIEWLKTNKKKYLFLTLLLLIIEIIFAVPSGSKERVFFPIAVLLFIYSFKSKFPLLPILLSISFFVIFVFPFIGIYRNIYLSGNIIEDLQNTYSVYKELFSNFNFSIIINVLRAIFADRLNNLSVVGIIVGNTPQIWDFKYGYSYFMLFIAMIPRIIWPDKPSISFYANDFGRNYGFISPYDYSTSIDMTWIGEMFINFGWYGMFVGFLYGFLYQTIYSYFLRRGKLTNLSILLYTLSLYYMIRGGMFAIQFSGLVKVIFLFLVILYTFTKRVDIKK